MIPIVWRFLQSQYLKVMGFCLIAFTVILLTTRLDDIAHFAALDASITIIFLFVLYQIPYILPIAIPISCLISAILLVQQLSRTHELTALRACGFSLKDLMIPILLVSAFIALANFYIVSELTTSSHFSTSLWKSELRSINPLLLLRNKHLMHAKGAFFDAMGDSRLGESASQVVMAIPNKSHERIDLFIAGQLRAEDELFLGENVSLVTTIGTGEKEDFDQLVVENVEKLQTTAMDFSQLLQRKAWDVKNDHLRMELLLSRLREEKRTLKKAVLEDHPQEEQQSVKKNIRRCYSEIIRRLSVAFAAFTFTLMGASFGISISRNRSYLSLFYVIGLVSMYLVAYFMAKAMDHRLVASILIYTIPHLIFIALSIWVLKRISKGIE